MKHLLDGLDEPNAFTLTVILLVGALVAGAIVLMLAEEAAKKAKKMLRW